MNWIREIVIGSILLIAMTTIGIVRCARLPPPIEVQEKVMQKPDCASSKLTRYTTKVNGVETFVPHRTDCVDSE